MSAESKLVRENVRRFALEVVAPSLSPLQHYPDGDLPAGLVPGLAELGLFELDADDPETLTEALESLSEVGAFAAGIVLANAVARSVQRRAFSNGNGTGTGSGSGNGHASSDAPELFAYPIYAEPGLCERGPRLASLGGELRLDGEAELVVNAPIAKTLVLPVRTEAGVALVQLNTNTNGVRVGPPLLTLGLRGAPTADVRFDGVRLSEAQVCRQDVPALLTELSQKLLGPALGISAGIVACSLESAVSYAKDRYQGGKSIIEHQEVRRLLSTVQEAAVMCSEAAARLAAGNLPRSRALALFAQAKERASLATQDGVQLLGGYGYMEDYPQERCMRDARQAQCLFGRVEHTRQRVAAILAGEVSP